MERAAAAATETRTQVKVAMISGSPWSGLPWRRDDEQLSRVLVPID
jgi:hypothetical protein